MRKKIDFWLILLILISLIPLKDFFHLGLPATHDGQDHVARIANFYQSLSEGNIVPRWAANLNWGYGHPILMFLYPLSSYLASFFKFLGFNFVDSTKAVFVLSFILSGIFMYFWLKEIWGREAGFIGGLLYMFAPYRFVDLYVRGAIGESLAFVWPPLILYFALKFSQGPKWIYLMGGSISFACLILSHNALSLMFLLVVFGYIAYLILNSNKKFLFIIHYSLFIILGFSLSAFFWLPAFLEGKYTLRDIVTKGNITGFEPLARLIYSPWSYGGTGVFSVQLGILQWLGVVLAPFVIWQFWRKKEKIWLFLLFLLIYFWISIFLILPFSRPLYFKITLLQKFQFAWRWLSLSIFPPAVFTAAIICFFPKKFKFFYLCLFIFISLYINRNFWHAKDYLYYPEDFYTQAYPGTTDTGESAPRWSVRFMEKFPKAHLEVIEGEAKIEEKERKSNYHEYKVIAKTPTRLLENTLYFPGWEILVSGKPVEVQFQDPAYRGLMTFNIPEGNYQVVIKFGETKLRQFANLVSLGGLTGLLLSYFVLKFNK
jgi:uncharacterized membrane protein